eukprot:TRINITY_DN2979_c0_g3_i2.p1 TRINITY_DN2979_c0_g3~~TRINITY_DN2979_c0_g3_i2.p1  ORF type:complete len:146 (+),score=39.70 TRINITY_DN2979_c0_g3_i2:181-618(+)
MLLACNKDLGKAHDSLHKIMQFIKDTTWTDPVSIITTLKHVSKEFSKICDNLLSCAESTDEFLALLKRVIYLSPREFINRIYSNFLANGRRITDAVHEGIAALHKRDFYTFGHSIGEVAELLVFKAVPQSAYRDYMKMYKLQVYS